MHFFLKTLFKMLLSNAWEKIIEVENLRSRKEFNSETRGGKCLHVTCSDKQNTASSGWKRVGSGTEHLDGIKERFCAIYYKVKGLEKSRIL